MAHPRTAATLPTSADPEFDGKTLYLFKGAGYAQGRARYRLLRLEAGQLTPLSRFESAVEPSIGHGYVVYFPHRSDGYGRYAVRRIGRHASPQMIGPAISAPYFAVWVAVGTFLSWGDEWNLITASTGRLTSVAGGLAPISVPRVVDGVTAVGVNPSGHKSVIAAGVVTR